MDLVDREAGNVLDVEHPQSREALRPAALEVAGDDDGDPLVGLQLRHLGLEGLEVREPPGLTLGVAASGSRDEWVLTKANFLPVDVFRRMTQLT